MRLVFGQGPSALPEEGFMKDFKQLSKMDLWHMAVGQDISRLKYLAKIHKQQKSTIQNFGYV